MPELTLQADISAERLAVRRALYERLEQSVTARFGGNSAATMTAFQSRAIDLLTSPATQRAFRISREPDRVRDEYGRNIYGQSVLLARRLIEAGTRVVTVSWAPDANATWDTHGSNFASLKNAPVAPARRGLFEPGGDLEERGLLERTIVAVLATSAAVPKINANNAGRDHWNYCYSLMMIGGGFKQGLVYGTQRSHRRVPGQQRARRRATSSRRCITSSAFVTTGRSTTPFGRPYRIVPSGDVIDDLIA